MRKRYRIHVVVGGVEYPSQSAAARAFGVTPFTIRRWLKEGKVCRNCNEQFVPNSKRNIYCSEKCKRAAQNKRYYKKHRRKIIKRVLMNQKSG